LAVITKANLWLYDYVYPIYKTTTPHHIYNQLVYPMETHDMEKVDDMTGLVVEELKQEYNRYILPRTMDDNPMGLR